MLLSSPDVETEVQSLCITHQGYRSSKPAHSQADASKAWQCSHKPAWLSVKKGVGREGGRGWAGPGGTGEPHSALQRRLPPSFPDQHLQCLTCAGSPRHTLDANSFPPCVPISLQLLPVLPPPPGRLLADTLGAEPSRALPPYPRCPVPLLLELEYSGPPLTRPAAHSMCLLQLATGAPLQAKGQSRQGYLGAPAALGRRAGAEGLSAGTRHHFPRLPRELGPMGTDRGPEPEHQPALRWGRLLILISLSVKEGGTA